MLEIETGAEIRMLDSSAGRESAAFLLSGPLQLLLL